MVARAPIPVALKKGWNTVFVKLPVGAFTTPEVRLIRWGFSFALVTPDGKDAIEGLIYSPEMRSVWAERPTCPVRITSKNNKNNLFFFMCIQFR